MLLNSDKINFDSFELIDGIVTEKLILLNVCKHFYVQKEEKVGKFSLFCLV